MEIQAQILDIKKVKERKTPRKFATWKNGVLYRARRMFEKSGRLSIYFRNC
jgi:hypothetical protein